MEKILSKTEEALSELKKLFSKFEENKINDVPFAGSWTAGQLAEHIALSNAGFVDVINGTVRETNQPADLRVLQLKEILLNFETKLTSPDFIYPADKVYHKDELINKFDTIHHHLIKSIKEHDLTKTCTSFELPGMGFITRLEVVHFVIYHTLRHTHQLKNIYLNLN